MSREPARKPGTPPPASRASLIRLPDSLSSSALPIMISSYFISQINLRSSTEIFCVLIAPVKTSENLASAPALDAAPLGDAPGGHGTTWPAWQALPPAQPPAQPGRSVWGRPQRPRAPSSRVHRCSTGAGVPGRCSPRAPRLSRRCGRAPGPPRPAPPRILTGCGGFLGAGPLRADVALQHGAARCPAPVRPGRARSWRGADGDSEGQGPSPAQEGTVPLSSPEAGREAARAGADSAALAYGRAAPPPGPFGPGVPGGSPRPGVTCGTPPSPRPAATRAPS